MGEFEPSTRVKVMFALFGQSMGRGFTIDTEDFLCDCEAKVVGGDSIKVELGKDPFRHPLWRQYKSHS
jgi:hypothetical protein